MRSDPQHLFSVEGDVLTPTDLVRGPWDHGLQHGGAICGALGWATANAALDPPLEGPEDHRFMLCRLTTEILRPVPAVPLRYRTSVDRAGRRSRVVSASLWDGDRCVARSSSQWALAQGPAVPGLPIDSAVPRRPTVATDPGSGDHDYPRPGFNCDVFELRCLVGSTEDPGPGTIWGRMTVDLVEGWANRPEDVLATIADLGNAVGWEPSPAGAPMVNPDVTLQLFRYPVGAWICLQSRARATGAGVGMMETGLWDGDGRFGLVLSTTMESTIPLSAGPLAAGLLETADRAGGAIL